MTENTTTEPAPRRLVIFADGTGSAFARQESNVWRLYQALDKSRDRQIARYIPGVGTSSIGLLRLLDGATGLGVPANVRKLYRFLCWNWRPGDEIYMFGFSRGAFTIRTLAALIRFQGLMPRRIGKVDVTTLDMHRNAMGAWRAYRKQTAPFLHKDGWPFCITMNPLIALMRELRDAVVWAKRKAFGQMLHGDVAKARDVEHPSLSPEKVEIRFLGLFDTVEAYGVPLEDLRKMIDWWLWPIMFRNRQCSAIVKNVRHALSLDEERLTFHPLRFDQGPRDDGKKGPHIREVWFAGVHSDVGGGYSDDELSFEPLLWVADEAHEVGLEFNEESLQRYRDRLHKHAQIHDSRTGMAAAYRYWPRPIGTGVEFGGEPVVHPSVVQKMMAASGGYAPLTLPDTFLQLQVETEGQDKVLPNAPTLKRDRQATLHLDALILWRRIANISFVAGLILVGVFPWIAGFLDNHLGFGQSGRMILGQMPELVSGLIPGFLSPWVVALWTFPLLYVPLIAAVGWLYLANGTLRDRIKDQGLAAWTGTLARMTPPPQKFLTATGTWLRQSSLLGRLYRFGAGFLTPLAIIVAALILALYASHVATLRLATAAGAFCPESTLSGIGQTDLLPGETLGPETRSFTPDDPCWFTGVIAARGRTYWIRLDAVEPFFDNYVASPLAGFASCSPIFDASAPLRRVNARWLQPVAQIGRTGATITPLEDVAGPPGQPLAPRLCPADHAGAPQPFVARFTAAADGPLFLFANDAAPFAWQGLYQNNRGAATVTIRADPPGL